MHACLFACMLDTLNIFSIHPSIYLCHEHSIEIKTGKNPNPTAIASMYVFANKDEEKIDARLDALFRRAADPLDDDDDETPDGNAVEGAEALLPVLVFEPDVVATETVGTLVGFMVVLARTRPLGPIVRVLVPITIVVLCLAFGPMVYVVPLMTASEASMEKVRPSAVTSLYLFSAIVIAGAKVVEDGKMTPLLPIDIV